MSFFNNVYTTDTGRNFRQELTAITTPGGNNTYYMESFVPITPNQIGAASEDHSPISENTPFSALFGNVIHRPTAPRPLTPTKPGSRNKVRKNRRQTAIGGLSPTGRYSPYARKSPGRSRKTKVPICDLFRDIELDADSAEVIRGMKDMVLVDADDDEMTDAEESDMDELEWEMQSMGLEAQDLSVCDGKILDMMVNEIENKRVGLGNMMVGTANNAMAEEEKKWMEALEWGIGAMAREIENINEKEEEENVLQMFAERVFEDVEMSNLEDAEAIMAEMVAILAQEIEREQTTKERVAREGFGNEKDMLEIYPSEYGFQRTVLPPIDDVFHYTACPIAVGQVHGSSILQRRGVQKAQ